MPILDILRARLQALLDERNAAQAELDGILAGVAAENRSDLTADEAARFGEVRTAIEAVDVTIDETRQRVDGIEASQAAAARAEEMSAELAARSGRPAGGAVVTDQPVTYRAGGTASFFADFFMAKSSPDAASRLAQHERETRAGVVANYAGLVVPQYLLDEFAPLARAGKPVVNALTARPLPPEGMTMNFGRVTTGTVTAVQATENSSVGTQDLDDTNVAVPVATIAGFADISRQAVDRGHNVDAELTGDLLADYAVRLDAQVINGSGAAGQILGILNTAGVNSVTYTDATPTLTELWPKLMNAIGLVNNTRFMPATVCFMTPLRWAWMLAGLDTVGRPIISSEAPMNVMGLGKAAEYGQIVGTIAGGIPVITDANIPQTLGAGTEDRIIFARASDYRLWWEQENPRLMTVDQVSAHTLTLRYVAYGYSAFTAGKYPVATAIVGGTGLIAPTF